MNYDYTDFLSKEIRDTSCISYVLKEESFFFDIGYKVMRNHENSGFIRCVKVSHNGKIKLIYDISSYESLQSVLGIMTANNFITVVSKLNTLISEVKNIGFMQYENIETNFEKIFIDRNNLNVFFIYLPVKADTDHNSALIFEKKIKENIINAIAKNPNLNNDATNRLYHSLQLDRQQSLNIRQSEASSIHNNNDLQAVRSGISGFDRKASQETAAVTFKPAIIFYGVGTPERVQFLINTPEFVIGNNPTGVVDGPITFSKAISRYHCKILWIDGKYYISDMGSTNGTTVNSHRLTRGEQKQIKIGDIIKLANIEFAIKNIEISF